MLQAATLPIDEPCTSLGATLADLPVVALHHEDLERMIPAREAIKGLEAFTDDLVTWGYMDNAEVTSMAPNPPGTCEDLARFGRIEGYARSFSSESAPGRAVLLVVHLFSTEDGARDWVDAFYGGLAAPASRPDSEYTFDAVQPWTSGLGIAVADHTGPEGTRTWAMLQRGPVDGWVIDLHPKDSPATIDMTQVAVGLAGRVEQVLDEAGARTPDGFDAARLLAAPLPLAAYGDRGAGLQWDSWFGGCQDTVERGLIAGDEAAALARRLGRVTGCTGMYDPAGEGSDIVRLFSALNVYADADGAAGALDALREDHIGRGGTEFLVEGIGDRAVGLVTPFSDGQSFTDSRVVFQVGRFTGSAVIDQTTGEARNDVVQLARQLEHRIQLLLGTGPQPAATP